MVNLLQLLNDVQHQPGPVIQSVVVFSRVASTLVLYPVILDPAHPALRPVHSSVAVRKLRNPVPAPLPPGSVELNVEIFSNVDSTRVIIFVIQKVLFYIIKINIIEKGCMEYFPGNFLEYDVKIK